MSFFPDFRNLLTTGNVISACAACFVAGMAWNDVNTKLSLHNERLSKIEESDRAEKDDIQRVKDDTQLVKSGMVKMDTQLTYAAAQIMDMKRWLEKISDQISSQKR